LSVDRKRADAGGGGEVAKVKPFEFYARHCPARFRRKYCSDGEHIKECEERVCVHYHFLKKFQEVPSPMDAEEALKRRSKMGPVAEVQIKKERKK
jgi:hypothetical protein